jgi:hypothetical protein
VTLVAAVSVSGAPGVTTLACLLASTWPVPGPVVVVECDPSGGDLAARFGLSATVGWRSLAAAVRRTGPSTSLDTHLQLLPGGLPVLIGARAVDRVPADPTDVELVRDAFSSRAGGGLAIVDLGRLAVAAGSADGWLGAADWTVVVVGGDAAAAVRIKERADELVARTTGRIGLVVVGGNDFRSRDLAEFTGLADLGDLAFDPVSAAVASGASGSGRRLERSRLLASMRRVAEAVEARTHDAPVPGSPTDRAAMGRPVDDAVDPGADRRADPLLVDGAT